MAKLAKWLTAAAVSALVAAPAWAEHSWSNYHWPLAAPVPQGGQTFEVYTRLTQDYWRSMVDEDGNPHDIIAEVAAGWDNAGSTTYTDYLKPEVKGPISGDPKKCDPLSGKIAVCSASYGFRGWLGVATVWTSGGHIVQATTKLNESYHNSGAYSSYSWRAMVACQEVGHDFGLGHQDEDFYNADKADVNGKQTCMDYTNQPAGNEAPNLHDYEQLDAIYDAHFNESPDGGGGGGGGPPPGKGPNKMDPFDFRQVGLPVPSATAVVSGDWGTAIGYDAHGRPNVFELDVPGGLTKVTHVTWAPGFRPEQRHMHDD